MNIIMLDIAESKAKFLIQYNQVPNIVFLGDIEWSLVKQSLARFDMNTSDTQSAMVNGLKVIRVKQPNFFHVSFMHLGTDDTDITLD